MKMPSFFVTSTRTQWAETPPDNARPTTEQLAALQSRLVAKRLPYADFGVFGPIWFQGRQAPQL